MARLNATNFSGAVQFPYATAATDLFRKEDVQTLALAVDQHDHTTGKGLPAAALAANVAVPGGGSTLNGRLNFTTTNDRINIIPGGFGLQIESVGAGKALFNVGEGGSILAANAYFDGTNWLRYNTGGAAMHINLNPTILQFYAAAAGSGAISWGSAIANLDTSGNLSLKGQLQGGTGGIAMAFNTSISGNFWINASGGNASISCDNFIRTNSGGYIGFDYGPTRYFQWNPTYASILLTGASLSVEVQKPIGFNYYGNSSAGQRIWCDGTNMLVASGGELQSLTLSGGSYAPCRASSFPVGSSRRIKTNIRTFEAPLALVLDDELHAVRYTDIDTDTERVGFVADDWLDRLPEVVYFDNEGEVAALDYDRVSAVTFEALKEYVKQTNARLDALEGKAA